MDLRKAHFLTAKQALMIPLSSDSSMLFATPLKNDLPTEPC